MPVNQKGFVHFFMLLLLLAGIGIGIYLVQHPTIFNPRADTNDTSCQASDAASFRNCLFKAGDETNFHIQKIEVTKQINCTEGGFQNNQCTFILNSRTSPLTISGTPGTNAGFKRTQKYNYPLLTLGGGTGVTDSVTLKDLIFDDSSTRCPTITDSEPMGGFDSSGNANCNSPFVLAPNLNNSTVDHITILHAKNQGIQVSDVTNLTIQNSIIFDSENNGIWFNAAFDPPGGCPVTFNHFVPCPVREADISHTVTIKNNLIADSRIAGLEFYAKTYNPAYPNYISGNLLVHNHRDAKYTQCPPEERDASGTITQVGGHCAGGQMSIARSNSLIVENNVIRNGVIDTIKPFDNYNPSPGVNNPHLGPATKTYNDLGWLNNGIEISETLTDTVIRNNKIYNNTGTGINADYVGIADYGIDRISIIWNLLSGNGGGGIGASGGNIAGFGAEGSTHEGYSFSNNNNPLSSAIYPRAFIFADPPICKPLSTDPNRCETTIRWYSEDYPGITMTVKGEGNSYNTVSDHPEGSSGLINWITINGATFQLRDANKTVLAETTVKYPRTGNDDGDGGYPDSSLPPTASAPVVWPDKKATGQITGASCTIPSGQTKCTSKITWSTSDAKGPVKVTIKETGGLFAQAPSGSQDFPWVSTAPLTMQLMDGDNPVPLASVVVKAAPAPSLITADPNPCKLSGGKCTSQIKLNATGYANLQIKIREANNATFTAVGANPTGTYTAPWISATPLTFDLYSNGSVIGSVAVKGTP